MANSLEHDLRRTLRPFRIMLTDGRDGDAAPGPNAARTGPVPWRPLVPQRNRAEAWRWWQARTVMGSLGSGRCSRAACYSILFDCRAVGRGEFECDLHHSWVCWVVFGSSVGAPFV